MRLTKHEIVFIKKALKTRLIQKIQLDKIYNLAAQSYVALSFEEPEYTVKFLKVVRCQWRK